MSLVYNQAFNVGEEKSKNGLHFTVRDNQGAIVYETLDDYDELLGMGIVRIAVPSYDFEGSLWITTADTEEPLDVIAIKRFDFFLAQIKEQMNLGGTNTSLSSVVVMVVDENNATLQDALVSFTNGSSTVRDVVGSDARAYLAPLAGNNTIKIECDGYETIIDHTTLESTKPEYISYVMKKLEDNG